MQCIYKSLTYLIFTCLTLHLYFTYFCLRRRVLYNYFILIHRITMFHFSPFTFAHTSIHTHILTNSLYLVAVMRGWIFSVWYVISLLALCVCGLFGWCHCTDYHKQNAGKCQASTAQIQTHCNERQKQSALAFSHWEPIIQSGSITDSLHAFAFSIFLFTIHSSYPCCFMHVGFLRHAGTKNLVLWHGRVHTHFLIFLLPE